MKTTIRRTLVILAVVTALGARAEAALPAEPCLGGGQIGPGCPAWVDINGNGVWDPAVDKLISFSWNGEGLLTIINPWSKCEGENATGNMVTFSNIASPCCTLGQASRNRPDNDELQSISVETCDGDGLPTAFSYAGGDVTGTGTLMPSGGPYSGMQVTGGNLDLLVGPFQGVDASGKGGTFDHATIPWAQSSMLGMGGPCKIAPVDPQIFVPVVQQTDGNFRIVPSITGMCPSPDIVLAAFEETAHIPALGEWGLIVLLLALATTGWVALRRSGVFA